MLKNLHLKIWRVIPIALTLLLALINSNQLRAYDFEVDGIFYNILTDNEVEVTYGEIYLQETESYQGNIDIPANVVYDNVNYKVIGIGKYAFYECNDLISIYLPETIISIGHSAFSGCISLISINLPESLVILEEFTFSNCRSLSYIELPDSLISIERGVFLDCQSLTNIIIPDLVQRIESAAFQRCTSLNEVFFGDSLINIGQGAFTGCSSLTEISFPNSVRSIGEGAFVECLSLSFVTIPSSVSYIGKYSFGNCSKLENIFVDEDNNYFTSVNGVLYDKNMNTLIQCPGGKDKIIIPESVHRIGEYAFYGCSWLREVLIPESVTFIGEGAFDECGFLRNIVLPKLLTKIEDFTFYNCSSLTSVIFPEGLTNIGFQAFFYCTSLSSINIPNTVETIEEGAFAGCVQLISVDLPYSIKNIEAGSFTLCNSLESITISDHNLYYSSMDGVLYSKNLEKLIQWPPAKPLTNFNWSPVLKEIGAKAFSFNKLLSIELPESISIIEESAFYSCSSLREVTCLSLEIPELGKYVFSYIAEDAVLYVYESVLEDYKNSDWAQYFSKIIPMEDPKVEVTSIEISPEGDQEMVEGEILVFTAVVTPEDATDATVVWTVDNEEVISIEVDEENPNEVTVTALASGEVVLTATAKDGSEVYAEVTITVTEAKEPAIKVTSIEILPEEAEEMTIGESLEFTAVVTPENATDATVVWTVDDEDVVEIEVSEEDPNEVTVTALAEGEVVLTAKAADGSGVFATVTITVVEAEPEPAPEVVTKYNVTFLYDETGVVAEGATITWQSEGKIEINPENEASVTATPLSSTLGEEIETTVKDNALVLDFTLLAVGTYSIYIPEGYVLIGENGINEGIGFNIAIEAVTGIAGLHADADGCYNVYKISGEKVVSTKEVSRLKNLEGGLYIINGKKIMIRK